MGTVGKTGQTRLENHIFCAYKGDEYELTDPLPYHERGWSSEVLSHVFRDCH
ncbi:hypothetical protein ACSSNL_08265 [Thalassobius sp. S69A]|uniref:hypothetical protein n=1 Tax=unclassified Thalassovita TaxID=2619711 RepID=UPI003C7C9C69